MTTTGIVVVAIIAAAFCFFIGYLFGGTKKGFLANTANELPRVLFSVVYTDKECTLLQEISIKKRHFLVSTKVFGGKPIRPKDVVRIIKNDKERKDLGIPVLGYPPLVKDIA